MESTLSLKKSDLEGEVGDFLGYGRGAANGDTAWDSRQTSRIQAAVTSGYRRFLYPPPIDQSGVSYNWSFMHPVASVVLRSGDARAALPDDFGGIEGLITLSSTSSQIGFEIGEYNEAIVRMKYAQFPSTTGQPEMVAVSPRRGTGTTKGQGNDLYVYPLANADYTLQFQYYVLPDALTDQNPYPYGGALHAETLKEACLAAAEGGPDDSMSVHAALFRERLAASISLDRRKQPAMLGYNRDRSDDLRSSWRQRWSPVGTNTITIGGVDPND